MKNVSEIKEKLIVWRDNRQIDQLMEQLPEAVGLSQELKETIINAALIFIDKLIKHIATKRPSMSSISNLMLTYSLKLWKLDEKITKCFFAVVIHVINSNFQGAFSNRLNVKSKEFMDLEDWTPE